MPDPSYVAMIVAGGQQYTSWTSVHVRRDYGDWVSTFEFSAAEQAGIGEGFASVPLIPGTPVQVYLGSQKIIDGSITTRSASFDANSHDLVVAGKSLTQALDSSAQVQQGTYNGSSFQQAAQGVMQATGVNLVIQNPPDIASKPFANLAVQYGEGVGEFVERIAKMRGFFLTDDADGNLVAGQADMSGGAVAALQEGVNILRGVCTLDNQNAWSSLNVAGQQPGTDQNWPPRDYSATVQGPSDGNGKSRTIIAEHPGDAQDFQQRVNFEAARAAWGQVDCQITVVGWFKDDGSLWIPAESVTVLSPTLFPSESGAVTLGIQACVYAQDSNEGTTTTLHLKKPEALSTNPNPFSGNTAAPTPDARPNQAQVDPPDTGGGGAIST